MTCLRARKVILKVVRGSNPVQYPELPVPAGWTEEQVLRYARSVHEPLAHTVTVHEWHEVDNVWLINPAAFADYKTGELA